jgi:hypothetical protein
MKFCSIFLLLGLMLNSSFLHADSEGSELWKCTAVDSTMMMWTVKAPYQRVSTNIALDACKKRSANPKSCKVPGNSCDVVRFGHSSHPLWRCTALDQLAKVWKSGIFSHLEEAALAAKAYCRQHSGFPNTCYTYVLMCKNYNNPGKSS